jgi:hypothetical protein
VNDGREDEQLFPAAKLFLSESAGLKRQVPAKRWFILKVASRDRAMRP